MDIETNDPVAAAKYLMQRLRDGKGAAITMPNQYVIFFAPASYFSGSMLGMFVSCSKRGSAVIESLKHVNRFAFVRAGFPSWAAVFAMEVLKQLVKEVAALPKTEAVQKDLLLIGVTPDGESQ